MATAIRARRACFIACRRNRTTIPRPWRANIDEDGKTDLIVVPKTPQLSVFKYKGTNVRGFPSTLPPAISGSPAVGDVDNDGHLEIVVFEFGGNFRVLRNN